MASPELLGVKMPESVDCVPQPEGKVLENRPRLGSGSESMETSLTRTESPEEEQKRREYVLCFLEEEGGAELMKNINMLLDGLKEESTRLEEQVLDVSSSVPPKVSAALCAAEEAQRTLEDLLLRERDIYPKLQQHLQDVQTWRDQLAETHHRVVDIERHRKYLQVLHRTQELSAAVQQCLMTNSVGEAIRSLDIMAALDSALDQSECSNLHSFLRETLCFWHKIIKDRLASDLEKLFPALHWPSVSPPTASLSPSAPSAPSASSLEASSQLDILVPQLLALQASDNVISASCPASLQPPSSACLSVSPPVCPPVSPPVSPPVCPPVCLPVQILLKPLVRRFRYHFTGNRQTNSLSKPEWYLTQVLMWISNNSSFMEEKIQPILDRSGAAVNAKVELCRGLVSLLQDKVSLDASKLLYDDALFCHLVEEVLQFEKELRCNHGFPAGLPVLLHLLLDEAVLQKWLAVERKMAVEKMDAMLSAEGAWSSQYKDISDLDELKVPDCAETFMTLLQVITERYRSLPSPSAQLQFLDLQRELVDDFRIRLTQVMKEESRCPLGVRYCSILNAVNYVSTVLMDWGDNVFFLQLQQAAVSLGSADRGLSLVDLGRLASLEGSLFDGLLALLDRLKGDMMGRLLDWTMRDISEKTRTYSQDRWLSVPPPQDQSSQSLSRSACPMMLCVRDRLLSLQNLLSSTLFQSAWQGLAERLNHLIYQEVILSNHFSEGGAAQLHFDMNRNLFPLFGHYCKKPENYFKHVKEACLILSLSVGSALLLKSVLSESDGESSPDDPPPISALNELGVFCLAPCDVIILLGLRTTLTGH